MDEVEGRGLDPRRKEVVLDELDVRQALVFGEGTRGLEHRGLIVDADHPAQRTHPSGEDAQPAQHTAAGINHRPAAALTDPLQQALPGRLPDSRLQLQALHLGRLPGHQVRHAGPSMRQPGRA